MNLEFNYHNSVITLPGALADKLDTASDTDLRLLILLAGMPGTQKTADPAELAQRLGVSEKDIELSISFWRGTGLIKVGRASARKTDAPPSAPAETEDPEKSSGAPQTLSAATLYNVDALPDYTGKQLEALMEQRRELGQLLKECQRLLEKVFNVSETNKIIAMTDYLHLPDDYILTLCSFCKLRGKGSVAYVVSEAKRLFNEEIVTVGALENYIEEWEKRQDFENFLRKLLGLGGAKLTANQRRFFDAWQNSGLPREVIAFAYETSVDSTGTLSMPHMNKIVETYRKGGAQTVEDAKKLNAARREEMQRLYGKQGKKATRGDNSDFKTFDVDEFFELARKKSRENAKK